MNVAVIVAAGSGTRFGGDTPKIFLTLKGVPVLARTIRKFEDCQMIDSIVVVVAEQFIDQTKQMISDYGLTKVSAVVAGRGSRSGSVRSGIAAVSSSDLRLVAIHDGARPLVSVADIEATIRGASVTGAAVLTVPVTDTVKEVREGKVVRTVDRNSLRRAVTPQVFNHEILITAMGAGPSDDSVTDESVLAEVAGFEVAVVEGSPTNIKITHPADMIVAEALIEKETGQ
jgi:2-C-methyl-D-erythritol 4-phosphate cytidylyltransferase